DQEARITRAGHEGHREEERHTEAEPDADDTGDDPLATPEDRFERRVRHHDRINETGRLSHVTGGPSSCQRGWTSRALKKYGISNAADSGESDPWTALASMDEAKSLRIVPGAALAGSVAPISSRRRAMAFSPSSTMGMHGPSVMNAQRL